MKDFAVNKTEKREFYIFLLWMYTFLLYNPLTIMGVPFFTYVDEAYAALAALIIVFNSKKIPKKDIIIYISIFIFISIGLISSTYYRYQNISVAMSDMFICVKFWVSILGATYMFRHIEFIYFCKKIYWHISLITYILFTLLCIDLVFNIFPGDTSYGMKEVRLFYNHPTVLVMVGFFLIAALVGISDYANKKSKYKLVMLSLIIMSTLKSKAFTCLAIFWFLYVYVVRGSKKVNFLTILLCAIASLGIAWEKIEYFFFSSIQNDSARYQLLAKSFIIANDHFPFGSGFGTFGSFLSGTHYSPLYVMYNLSNVHGLSDYNYSFVSDSFWPMVLGQTGWFGLITYCILLLFIFFRVEKLRRLSNELYLSGLTILLYLLISSTAESAFVNPITIPMALWLAILFNLEKTKYSRNVEVNYSQRLNIYD